MSDRCQRCGIEGAAKCIVPSFGPGDEPDEFEYLCFNHALEAGYCFGCGYHSAGCDEYDFSPVKGYCGECTYQIRAVFDEDYDPYEPFPGGFHHPSRKDWSPKLLKNQ